MKNIIKKLQNKSKYILIAVISISWLMIFLESYQDSRFYWSSAVHETGEMAWFLLMFTVFVSLFYKLSIEIKILNKFSSGLAKILPLRKYTGIFAFLIAFSHVVATAFKIEANFFSEDFYTFISEDISMTFGMIAFLAMLPAFITSTEFAIKKLGGKFWKNIQRLTHIAFIFTALHIAFLKSIEIGPFIILSIYFLGYGYLWSRKLKK